jgi:hypothetical protein
VNCETFARACEAIVVEKEKTANDSIEEHGQPTPHVGASEKVDARD